jgi:mRNA interferase HigB
VEVPAVRTISKKRLREFWTVHPDAREPLLVWYQTAKRAQWRSFADIRKVYRTADQVGKFTVFNIGGNKYRLIAEIIFRYARLYVRHVLTHREYDRGKWKSG